MDETVLVGTAEGLYAFGDHNRAHFEDREVSAIARTNSGCWVIIDGREIWHSDSNGEWIQTASVDTARAICLLPTEAEVLIGTSQPSLLALRGETLEPVRSFESVPGRDAWYTPWGGPPDVRSMAAGPPGTLYVNVHVGGIARSRDGGESWEPTIDIYSDVHQVLYHSDSGLLLAASGEGLAVSDDDGASWRFYTEGLHGTYLRAVAVADNTVLVTASTGASTQRSAVYRRSARSSEPFERCRDGLPEWFADNIDTLCLSTRRSCAAFGTSDGQLFYSSDEGQSWQLVTERLPRVLCSVFVA